MKKSLTVLLACSLLGACVYHETDLQAAQERRDAALAQKRAQVGCSFVRDHDAYRQCLLDTYYSSQPKGYETRNMTNGQPVAIVSNPNAVQPLPCNSGCGCGGCTATPNYYQMQAQIAPLPASGPQVIPYTTTATTTVDTSCTRNYVPQVASVTTTEVIPAPAPVVVTPQPKPTWWQEYKTTQRPAEPVKPICPCPDPNDPCPQCVEK